MAGYATSDPDIGTARDREKLDYLNPVPLRAIQECWIVMFEDPACAR